MKGKNGLMLTCSEATDYVSRLEEGKLSFSRKAKLRLHLLLCHLCRKFSVQNRIIVRLAGKVQQEETLPPQVKKTWEEALKN